VFCSCVRLLYFCVICVVFCLFSALILLVGSIDLLKLSPIYCVGGDVKSLAEQ